MTGTPGKEPLMAQAMKALAFLLAALFAFKLAPLVHLFLTSTRARFWAANQDTLYDLGWLLLVVLALVFLHRPLATRMLPGREEPAGEGSVPLHPAFRIGTRLMGIWLLATKAPAIVRELVYFLPTENLSPGQAARNTGCILFLLATLYLLGGARGLEKLAFRDQEPH